MYVSYVYIHLYIYIYIYIYIYLYICIYVCIYYGLWALFYYYIYVYNMYYYIYIWSLCAFTCWMGSEAHYPFTVTEHGHCDCVYNWRWKNQWELKFSSKFRYEKIIRHVEFQYLGITTLNLPVSCISESCIGIKIKLNFYFHTSLWCFK